MKEFKPTNLFACTKSFMENQTMVENLWKQYQISKDPKWLAEICLNVPFFDHPEVGKEIAELLKTNKQ